MGMNKVIIDVEARFTDHVTGSTRGAEKSINDMGKAAESAQRKLDGLGRKRTRPTLDANESPLLRKVNQMEARARRLAGLRPSVMIGAQDRASQILSKVTAAAKRFASGTYRAVLKIKDSGAMQMISKLNSGLRVLTKGAWTAVIRLKNFALAPLTALWNRLFSIKTLVAGIMGGLVAQKFMFGPVQQYADYEDLVTQFSVLLGSQQAAEQRMQELVSFAGKTPFTRDDIFQASRVLQTYTGGALATPDAVGGLTMVGDVAAATGRDLSSVAMYFGRLYNEVARGGQALGEPLMFLREIGALTSENETAIQKIAQGSGTVEQKWAQVAAQFSRTNGMMEAMSDQMNNLLLGVKAFWTNTVKMNLGRGISESLKPFLSDFRKWRNENSDLIAGWGDSIRTFSRQVSGRALDAVRRLAKRADELFRSDAFKDATLGGKVKLAFDTLVADPLRDWWNSGGQAKTAAAAGRIGGAIGGLLSDGIKAFFGGTALLEGVDASGAGASVAQSFVQGFRDNFDSAGVKAAIHDALAGAWDLFKDASPGGKVAMAAGGAYLGNKLLGPLFRAVKVLLSGPILLGQWLHGKIKGRGGAGDGSLSQQVATMHVNAGVVYVNGAVVGSMPFSGTPTPAWGKVLSKLPAGSAAAPLALPGETAGAGAAAGGSGVLATLSRLAMPALELGTGLFAGFTALRGAQEIYRGGKLLDQGDTLGGYTQQGKGFSKLGAVGGGAAIGALGGPLGMLAGAGIGALGGWFLSDVIDKSEKLAVHAKQTHRAIKGSIGEARSLGRAFEETPLYDDPPIMRLGNALERAKYKARIGEYADVYKPGPYQTQTSGRVFEAPVEVTPKLQLLTGGLSDRARELLGKIEPVETEIPVNPTLRLLTGEGGMADRVREALGKLSPAAAETVTPKVWIDPSYMLTGNTDPTGLLTSSVPGVVSTASAVAIGTTYSVKNKLTDAMLAKLAGVKDNYSASATLAINLAARVTSNAGSVVQAAANEYNRRINANGRGFRGGIFGGPSALDSFSRGGIVGGGSYALAAYARGGVPGFSDGGIARGGSQLIRVAEEGSPEMIIPLSSQRRDRGLKLWEKAGDMLGVPGYARGGVLGGGEIERVRPYGDGTTLPRGGGTWGGGAGSVDVGGVTVQGVNLTIHVDGSKGDIMGEIRAHKKEITDVVAGAINDALVSVFENTPRGGGLSA